MANPEHLKILKQGASAWNKWSVENRGITPDLDGADLREADHRGADLRGAFLWQANLYGANLAEVRAGEAIFAGANLYRAEIKGADLRGAYLHATKPGRGQSLRRRPE